MTISDLRVLVNNLDEYVHIPGGIQRLKKTVLHLAVSGQIAPQDDQEGTGEELYAKIQNEKAKSAKKQKPLPDIELSEVPYRIPSSWKWVRLGNVTNYGSTEKSKPKDISQDTWVLELEDIEKGSSKLLQKVLASSRASLSDKNVFLRGDVLYGKLRPYLDKVLVADEDGVCTSEILPIRGYGHCIDPSYLRLFLKSPNFIRIVNDITYGVKMPRLGTDDGRKLLFALPPLVEQQRIVKRVEDIFTLIDELDIKYKAEEVERARFVKSSLRKLSRSESQLALDNLETIKTKSDAAELRKAILHLAVSGQIVPQNSSEGTGEELYEQIKGTLVTNKKRKILPLIAEEEKPFSIPSSWIWVRLIDISKNLGAGGDKPKDFTKEMTEKNTIPVIANGETNEGIIGFTNSARVTETSVTVSGRGTIGYSVVRNYPYTPIVRLLVITPPRNILPEYIQFVFSSLFEGGLGTSIPQLTVPMIAPKPIPLPPLLEQKRIVQKTTELLELVRELEKHL